MIKKIKSNSGETLAETLVAILIAALSIVMVTTSVIVAARINDKAKKEDVSFVIGTPTEVGTVYASFSLDHAIDSEQTPEAISVVVRSTANGYYYYDYKTETGSGTGTGD